jgi:hypothetical protein
MEACSNCHYLSALASGAASSLSGLFDTKRAQAD